MKTKTMETLEQPIQLTEQEIQWIKLLKGHYEGKYPHTGHEWTDVLKPMFEEIYGYNPQENKNDFLNCIFEKLLDIYLKIQLDGTGCNGQLKQIFDCAFHKSFFREQELPIERAISELCGLIQCNKVNENGVTRYNL